MGRDMDSGVGSGAGRAVGFAAVRLIPDYRDEPQCDPAPGPGGVGIVRQAKSREPDESEPRQLLYPLSSFGLLRDSADGCADH